MAKSTKDVAEDIQHLLQINNKDVITFPWPDFYRVAKRDRIKDAFKDELETKLNQLGLLVCYGQAVVLVAKDFRFSVVTVPKKS